jgi:hypothetical protein
MSLDVRQAHSHLDANFYIDIQGYVPIGFTEETSALAGSNIVEPSEGSLR